MRTAIILITLLICGIMSIDDAMSEYNYLHGMSANTVRTKSNFPVYDDENDHYDVTPDQTGEEHHHTYLESSSWLLLITVHASPQHQFSSRAGARDSGEEEPDDSIESKIHRASPPKEDRTTIPPPTT